MSFFYFPVGGGEVQVFIFSCIVGFSDLLGASEKMLCIPWGGEQLLCDKVASVSRHHLPRFSWWEIGFWAHEIPVLPLQPDAPTSSILPMESQVSPLGSAQMGVGRVGWESSLLHLWLCSSSIGSCQTSAALPLYLHSCIGINYSVSQLLRNYLSNSFGCRSCAL